MVTEQRLLHRVGQAVGGKELVGGGRERAEGDMGLELADREEQLELLRVGGCMELGLERERGLQQLPELEQACMEQVPGQHRE